MTGYKDGIININKPAEWTSQDVCAKLRGRLHIKKIGHTGTLDPMATGVLPVCIGKATRIIEFYDRDFKTYRAEMKLGLESDTLDIWGDITAEHPFEDVTEEAVTRAFAAYTGEIEQVPPKYSALRVNGRRAYDLARAGGDFELPTRKVTIRSMEVTGIDLSAGTVSFETECSKGTYIRTICDDIGRSLGCGAVMTALTRTASGFFRIEDSVDIRDLVEMTDEEIAERFIPMDETLVELGKAILDDNRIIAFLNGNSTGRGTYRITEKTNFGKMYKVYAGDVFAGIGETDHGALVPRKILADR